VELEASLSQLPLLIPRTFTWKQTGDHDAGFNAQELQRAIPQLVDDHEGLLHVHYLRLIPYIVKWLQLLHQEVTKRTESPDSSASIAP